MIPLNLLYSCSKSVTHCSQLLKLLKMNIILYTILLLVLFKIAHFWYKLYEKKKKLNWLPHVPGWPFIGAILQFGRTSDTIPVIERMIHNNGEVIVAHLFMEVSIVICEYDFLEYVLGSTTLLTKSSAYRFLTNWLGTGLLTSTGSKWKQRRKLTTPAFHFSILREFVKSFETNSEIMVAKLKRKNDKEEFDIYPYLTLCAMDIICETAMGVKVEAQKHEDSEYVKNVKKMCRIGTERTSSLIKSNDYLYPLTIDHLREKMTIKQLHDVTNSIIDSRMNKLKERNNLREEEDDTGRKNRLTFLDILIRANVDGKSLTKEDIREEVDTFMFEGHDTTSAALGFALHLLSNHSEVQDRVFKEQTHIFEDDIHRPSTYDDLQQMKYLEQVIKETLRLYPSVPIFARRTTEDIKYKGNVIPKGVNLTIFCYGILRNAAYFPNPNAFNPERFETMDGDKPYSYIPFSAGPRNCIGQKFAMLEMKTVLSKIIRNFVVLPAKNHEVILLTEAVLKSKNGISVRLADRKL